MHTSLWLQNLQNLTDPSAGLQSALNEIWMKFDFSAVYTQVMKMWT